VLCTELRTSNSPSKAAFALMKLYIRKALQVPLRQRAAATTARLPANLSGMTCQCQPLAVRNDKSRPWLYRRRTPGA
jgi:hypothetical protein